MMTWDEKGSLATTYKMVIENKHFIRASAEKHIIGCLIHSRSGRAVVSTKETEGGVCSRWDEPVVNTVESLCFYPLIEQRLAAEVACFSVSCIIHTSCPLPALLIPLACVSDITCCWLPVPVPLKLSLTLGTNERWLGDWSAPTTDLGYY